MRLALAAGMIVCAAAAQPPPAIPRSQEPRPHFEAVDGRQVFFTDGYPFVSLAIEIPWMDLIYGRYRETMGAYDFLYLAAGRVGFNTLKVPVKWSMVEPREGVYDFSYVDHAKAMAERNGLKLILGWFGHYASGDGTAYRNLSGEVFAPMYVIEDDKRFPRAIDADGIAHHNCLSYDDEEIIRLETAAFRAFMEHIRKVDSGRRTILMVQVENEIAVFGADRQNKKLWRDHSPASNRLFAEKGFTDDLRYSAWSFSSRWIRRLTDAGAAVYPIPYFVNFVGGQLAEGIVGGSPGEDVATYLENCPNLSFVGLNHYQSTPEASANDFRAALTRYRVGRNLPTLTETNSDRSPHAPRFLFLSVGEFGSPLFAPWALNISYPGSFQPYVMPDGSLANGAFELRDALTALSKALPLVAVKAASADLRVFLAGVPGKPFTEKRAFGAVDVTVTGEAGGQAIVIRHAPGDFTLLGYRCRATFATDASRWPGIRNLRVAAGAWTSDGWLAQPPAPRYSVNQAQGYIGVALDHPQAVRIRW